jgi:5-methylcytosine-specific restriction endonuclease McrA
MCEDAGRIVQASVVDHIKPHKGNQALFWNPANWQSLCKRCHDSDKQRIEAGNAPRQQIGRDGWPVGG